MIRLTDDQQKWIISIREFIKGMTTVSIVEEMRHTPARKGRVKDVVRAARDFIQLLFLLRFMPGYREIVFISNTLTSYEKYFVSHAEVVYINYHNKKVREKVNDRKVFNIGIITGLLNRTINPSNNIIRHIKICNAVYSVFYPLFRGRTIFIPCFYDFNGFTLILNSKRNLYKLTEVQHGSISGFLPYMKPTTFSLVDQFVACNTRSADHLQKYLYKNVRVGIQVRQERTVRHNLEDNHLPVLLYCSTVETRGMHPNMLSFLTDDTFYGKYRLKIRLHPRENDIKKIFVNQLSHVHCDYEFDTSPEWLDGNRYKNMLLISPWSSVIEEACENGITCVVIDEMGKERFKDFIDDKICFYSENISHTLEGIFPKLHASSEHSG